MNIDTAVLGKDSITRLAALEVEAAKYVADTLYATNVDAYPGETGQAACRGDFRLILEFLRSVLQFGALKPLVDGLHWLAGMLMARGVDSSQFGASMERLGAFFATRLPEPDVSIVAAALHKARLRAEGLETSQALAWANVPDAWSESTDFEAAILAGDRTTARRLLFEGLNRSSLVEAEHRLIQPALYRIGMRWQRNEVSVAQEHIASITVQSIMTDALLKAPLAAWNGRRALLACVAGNHHAIGLQMVADALELAGWSTRYLGSDVPTHAILSQNVQQRPDVLGLSLSFPQQLVHVREIMNQLNKGSRPRVIVGGLAIKQLAALGLEYGVDGVCTEAAGAVDLAERLVATSEAA